MNFVTNMRFKVVFVSVSKLTSVKLKLSRNVKLDTEIWSFQAPRFPIRKKNIE